jgi:transposase, IS6 family
VLAERGVEVDHVTAYRWVRRFTSYSPTPLARSRTLPGIGGFVDETYVKIAGRWRYLYGAVDRFGQVIDVLLSGRRDTEAARRFFRRALQHCPALADITSDKAGPYLRVLDELVPAAVHVTEQYANNRIEADHGRLKARIRPMRGLKRLGSAAVSPSITPSIRTSAVATTNSPSTHRHHIASRQPSPSYRFAV